MHTYAMVTRQAFKSLSRRGLALRIYTALLLRGRPGESVRVSYREIAEQICSSKSTVTKGCAVLVELGLIRDTLSGGKSTKVWKILGESESRGGCQDRYGLQEGCQINTPRGVRIGPVVGPTIVNNSKDNRQHESSDVLWSAPKWASGRLLKAVKIALSGASPLLAVKRSQAQDRWVWQAVRRYETEADSARCAKLRNQDFWGEILKSADWPEPPKGIGRLGYGKRMERELDKKLEAVAGEDKLMAAADEHLKRLKGSFDK